MRDEIESFETEEDYLARLPKAAGSSGFSGTSPLVVKDSGERRSFGNGAVRDLAIGKGRFDLLPPNALRLVAQLYEAGAIKYDARNWEKGIPLSVFMDSGIRHANYHLFGYDDERHDLAAAWNFLCLIETQYRIGEGILPATLDDLPHTGRGYAPR
jgi:hypothetical protein